MTGPRGGVDAATYQAMTRRTPMALTAVMSYDDVATAMTSRGYPMSRERVVQIEQRALHKLYYRLIELRADTQE